MSTGELLLIGLTIALVIAGRMWARSWIRNRWLSDRISDRHAGLLIGLLSVGPLLVAMVFVIWSAPEATPIIVLGALPAAVILIGLTVAVIDYISTRGVKESIKRSRAASSAREQ